MNFDEAKINELIEKEIAKQINKKLDDERKKRKDNTKLQEDESELAEKIRVMCSFIFVILSSLTSSPNEKLWGDETTYSSVFTTGVKNPAFLSICISFLSVLFNFSIICEKSFWSSSKVVFSTSGSWRIFI